MDKIRATLSFYANPEIYRFDQDPWGPYDYPVLADKGKRARDMLDELGPAGTDAATDDDAPPAR